MLEHESLNVHGTSSPQRSNKRSHELAFERTASSSNNLLEQLVQLKKFRRSSPPPNCSVLPSDAHTTAASIHHSVLPLSVTEHFDQQRTPTSSTTGSCSSTSSLCLSSSQWQSNDSIKHSSNYDNNQHHYQQQQQQQQQQQPMMLPVIVEGSRVDDDDVECFTPLPKPVRSRIPTSNVKSPLKSSPGDTMSTRLQPQPQPLNLHASIVHESLTRGVIDIDCPSQMSQAGLPQVVPRHITSFMRSLTPLPASDVQLSDGERSVSASQPLYDDSDMDDGQSKLQQKRERNKMAARKCRARKMDRITSLQSQCDYLRGENATLQDEMKSLSAHVKKLRQTLDQHVQSGCSIDSVKIQQQQLARQHHWTTVVEHSADFFTDSTHCLSNF